jgi:hypothetical protein
MSSPREQELDGLLAALVDGGLSYAEQQHLAALLRDDPALQERYRDYLLLDAMLQWEAPAVPAARTGSPSPRRRFRPRVLVAAAAGLLLLLFGSLFHFERQTERAAGLAVRVEHDVPEVPPTDLAVLTRSVRAEWAEGSPAPGVGTGVAAGPLKLIAGLVQFEFYSGATLVIEGPADFEVRGADRLYCRSGKLRATVPPQARGFTVLSDAADLVDLGTEFGLEVTPDGATEAHVFTGKVEVHAARTDRPGDQLREVSAGQGLRVEESGRRTEVAANAGKFASRDEVDRRAKAALAERRESWRRAVERLHRDPRLVAHHPFERRPAERTLAAANAPGAGLDGAIIGCEWAE